MKQILQIYKREISLYKTISSEGEKTYWQTLSQALDLWDTTPLRAIHDFLVLSESGDARTQTGLGLSYYLASELEFHKPAAVYWLSRAAGNDFTLAHCAIGTCYLSGIGIEVDLSAAERWFKLAAERDYAPGQFMLGRYLYQQFEDTRHKELAIEWFQKAAEQGYAPAQYILGLCCMDGIGTLKAPEKGIAWVKLAAEQGDIAAIRKMIELHKLTGDIEDQVYWIRQGAATGDTELQYQLALNFEYGTGVEQSYRQAAIWYRKAVERLQPADGKLSSTSK